MHNDTTSGTGDGPVSRHPFIFQLFLPFLGGLLAAPFVPPSPRLVPATLAAVLPWLIFRRRAWSFACLGIFMILFGIALYHLALAPPAGSDRIGRFSGKGEVTVEAVVAAPVRPKETGSSVDLAARRIWRGQHFAPVSGGIRLFIREGQPAIHPGDRIRFRARLQRPRRFGTPAEFDYPRYLARRNIFVTARAADADRIVRFGGPSRNGPAGCLAAWRRAAGDRIGRALPERGAVLVRALVLGDKSGFDDDLRDLLACSGLSHLFAISGLHLGMIGLFGFAVVRILYLRSERLVLWQPPRRILPVLLVPILFGYLLFTGAALPTRRAFLMGSAAALLAFRSRPTPLPNLLAVAAFAMLLADPLAFCEPGFQLSFAGLAGIALWLPPWIRRTANWPRPLRWVATGAAVTLSATLATAPLVLLHFHILAPAGPVANLFAVPLVGFAALPLGLAGLLFCPVLPALADEIFRACGLCLETILDGASALLRLPGLEGLVLYPPPRHVIAFGMAALALLLLPRFPGRRRLCVPVLIVLGLWLRLVPASPPPVPTVIPLSVGQGEATLLLFPDGRRFLVDGGGMPGSGFDVGERLVAPALARLGVTDLDGIVLSHAHPDHWLGLVHVAERFPVGRFWSGLAADELPGPLRRALEKRNVPVTTVPPGWHGILREGRLAIFLFVPPQKGRNHNDRSVAAFFRWDDFEVLLPGDLEARGVARLAAATPPAHRPVSLLKLPHHGSRHSRVELLLDRFRPRLAWVSSGASNPYRLPHPDVVQLLKERGVPLARTDRRGTLRLRPGNDRPLIEEWRQGLFR